ELRGLGNLGFLHEAEILGEERLCAQTTIRRRGVAEEAKRIGIVSDVRGIHRGSHIERERRRVAKIERTRERRRIEITIISSACGNVGVERLPGDVGPQVAEITRKLKEVSLSACDKRRQRRTASIPVNSCYLPPAKHSIY